MDMKSKRFHMRFTPGEMLALEQLSKRERVNKSEYVRRLVCEQAKKKKIPIGP